MTLKEMARPMAAQPVVDDVLVSAVRDALVSNALPGELDGFTAADRDEAATFVVEVAARRKPGELALKMKSIGGEASVMPLMETVLPVPAFLSRNTAAPTAALIVSSSIRPVRA